MSLLTSTIVMMIIDFCDKYNMLPKGALVLCAVSGGKDSVFLLHWLCGLREDRGLRLASAHFDHSLRGEESDRDRVFTKELCDGLGIDCHIGKADVAAFSFEKGMGIEEAARFLRYEFLEKTAQEIGADRIATAHTADDNAETLLLNLARGSGLTGLCGIPPVRGKIIRPLLETSSAEILEYLREKGIKYVEDSTNAQDDYSRNRLRHRVMPELRSFGGFDENVTRCIGLLREDEAYLSGLAEDFISENLRDAALPAAALSGLPGPVAARVVKKLAPGASARHIEAVLGIASGSEPHAMTDIPGIRVRREYDMLIFGGETGAMLPERELPLGGTLRFEEAGLQISAEYLPCCVEINNSDNTFFFQNDSICDSITAGPRKDGDSIRLVGRNGTKTLKKLFSEAKLNGEGKNMVLVLRDGAGPIAIPGFGIAQRCAAKPGDNVICVCVERL